ncbi:MAG TPA: VWA domain-containing protein, partial [Gemmataceae bacterium]|nr:VWA domain-containing protein [Gemmataceae bacterium]
MAPFAIAPLFAFLFDPFTAAAAAGGAVSIPIIIHLLNRKRYRIVPWAAMRFLLAAQRKTSRKVRIEQILLLIVRCLIVLLLLLAMCSVTGWAEAWFWRPFAGKGFATAGGTARTHRILVVDGSLGMGFKEGDQDSFARAKAAAKQIVKESNGGDGFSVLLLADPPRMIVPGPTEDADPGAPSEDVDRVVSRLDALRPTHGNADLAAALNTVEDILKASPRKYAEKEVYFLSNLQRSTWLAREATVLAPTIKQIKSHAGTAVLVDVGKNPDDKSLDKRPDNLAVESLTLAEPVAVANQDVLLQAVLHNFGGTRTGVVVHLRVGKVEADGQAPVLHEVAASDAIAEIKDGEQVPVTLRCRFPKAGDYVAQVEVKPDGLEADDSRRVVVSVKEKVRVLLVDGKNAARASDGAAELVRLALNPFPDEASAVENNVVARTKVIDDKAFADEGLGDLSGYDCVFLCDMPKFTDGEVRRLLNHVRDGGGVVFVSGDRVDLNEYNNTLSPKGAGLLPCRFVGKQTDTDTYSFEWRPQPDLDAEPAFKPFKAARPRDLLQVPHFQAFLRVEPALEGKANATPVHTLMKFTPVPLPGKKKDDNPPADGPAVLEWRPPSGKEAAARDRLTGHVILVTTTLNGDWEHLPANGLASVFIDRLMQFAASGRLREQAIDVGQPIEVFAANANAGNAVVHTPDGREESAPVRQLDDGAVVYWQGADVSGVYTVSVGGATHLVAVNPPALNAYQGHASDLARATPDEIKSAFPDWDLQIVGDLGNVKHAAGAVGYREPDPIGPAIAHVLLLILLGLFFVEVVLAWLFGHYTAVATLEEEAAMAGMTRRRWLAARLPLYLLSALFVAALVGVGFVLIHYAATGDFLSFMPDGIRAWWEGRPPLAAGESRHWTLESSSATFWNNRLDPWLTWIVLGLGTALVLAIYFREGRRVGVGHRLLMAGLRLGLLLLLILVILPQLRVWYERQAAPDLVLILDDSKSMSTVDKYRDPKIQAAADALAKRADVPEADRLRLAQTIVTRPETDWLRTLLTQRNVRLHIYHCSSRLHRLADVTKPEELGDATTAIQSLPPEPPRDATPPGAPSAAATDRAARFAANDSTQIGTALRQVLAEYNASSLAGVVVLTDGVSTEGENLDHVADAARDQGVPLFFVGIGDANEMHNLRLHDLQAVDSVYVNDHIVFDLMLHGVGYPGQTVPITLKEKGKDEVLEKKDVTLNTADDDVKVQLQYKPTEPGERTFVIETPLKPDESDKEDNRVERKVFVREAKLIKVLYVEGYRRYEFHFLKTLLERESDRVKNNKTMDLKVVLLSADPGFEDEERNALKEIPSKEELNNFDVILLGDVNPHPKDNGEKMTEHLKDIAEWVTEHGGGLLMIAGDRYAPFAYRDSPLKDVLPVEVVADHLPDESTVLRTEGFRPELTPDGERHPIFRFEADVGKNKEAWDHLRDM